VIEELNTYFSTHCSIDAFTTLEQKHQQLLLEQEKMEENFKDEEYKLRDQLEELQL